MNISDFVPTQLNLLDALTLLRPLVIYVLGMAIYAVFIFKFYRFVGSKDIFEFDLTKYEDARFRSVRVLLHSIMYIAKYLIVFPFIAFFWVTVLTVLLTFLAKNQSLPTVLLIAIAVVSAIRVTSYYNEDLSRDLAKILPFALLGVFVIDFTYFRIADSLDVLRQVADQAETILYYLIFVIILELALRIAHPVLRYAFSGAKGPGKTPTVVINRDAVLTHQEEVQETNLPGGSD